MLCAAETRCVFVKCLMTFIPCFMGCQPETKQAQEQEESPLGFPDFQEKEMWRVPPESTFLVGAYNVGCTVGSEKNKT